MPSGLLPNAEQLIQDGAPTPAFPFAVPLREHLEVSPPDRTRTGDLHLCTKQPRHRFVSDDRQQNMEDCGHERRPHHAKIPLQQASQRGFATPRHE